MSDEALRQIELYATRCDYREGRCKSCRFVLELVAEVKRLRTTGDTSHMRNDL